MKRGVLSLSTLYPDEVEPFAGLFVRERLSRLATCRPLVVLAPVPWFPGQSLVRLWRPRFRPAGRVFQQVGAVQVLRPRFLSFPGVFKRWDGWLIALCCMPWLLWLRRRHDIGLVDAHFGYPEGAAARLLSRWCKVPFIVTLRGTEPRHAEASDLLPQLRQVLQQAAAVICVSESLRSVARRISGRTAGMEVIGNGVDSSVFHPLDRRQCRDALGLPPEAKVLVTVGGLVERKGFHRVLEILPVLRARGLDVRYLIVGAPGAEGDFSDHLRSLTTELGLEPIVRFLGAVPPDQLSSILSAADVFVLATRNEGWANVLLEAMACGLPVVATDRGGNQEVVNRPDLGTIVPFGDAAALQEALFDSLGRQWDRSAIVTYAKANSWNDRISQLDALIDEVTAEGREIMA